MSAAPIAFGTSGWRGILADDFTFTNLRRVTRAIARLLREESGSRAPRLFVGYDTRFLSEILAREVAHTLEAEGVRARLSNDFVPTPVVAHAIRKGRFDGGVNLTASHNPAEYNGLKFSTRDGAPAPYEVTKKIESFIREIPDGAPSAPATKRPALRELDPAPASRKDLQRFFDRRVIQRSGLKVVADPVYGAGRGYLPAVLGRTVIGSIRTERDATFGGHGPDCNEKHLGPLLAEVRRTRADLGLATDGDADRFGIVDRGGRYVPSNLVLALLADYLLETRKFRSGIARSVATTHLLDDVAAYHNVAHFETPVGFKHFQSLLLGGQAFLAGEESSGLSIAGHVPEKDGVLAGCLVAEMVSRRRRSLADQIKDLFRKVGPRHSRREDHHVTPEQMTAVRRRLENPPSTLAGRRVIEVKTIDGTKMIREDAAWLLIRLSGTEPVVRCYAEAKDPSELTRLLDAGRALLRPA